MAKTHIPIDRDAAFQPPRDKEVSAFVHMMQQPTGRAILARFGMKLPPKFDIIHHSNPDDPPDMEILGVRFEHTEFPPNQTTRQEVFKEHGGPMSVPPFQVGKSIDEIRDAVDASEVGDEYEYSDFITGGFHPVDDEIAALEKEFLVVLGRKDKSTNQVLLLDSRVDFISGSTVGTAIRNALAKQPPKHLRLIVLVRTASFQIFPAFDEAVMTCRP